MGLINLIWSDLESQLSVVVRGVDIFHCETAECGEIMG